MPYAVIEWGGKQLLVQPGMTVRVEKIDAGEGETVVFSDVLLVKTDEGETHLQTGETDLSYEVVGKLVRHERARKIIVFKKRRKETYKRKQGHRQWLSLVQITEIRPKAD